MIFFAYKMSNALYKMSNKLKKGKTMKNNLKEVRTKVGMSQTELAKKSNVSRQTINEIENNRRSDINTSTIEKIAMALYCKPSDIFSF